MCKRFKDRGINNTLYVFFFSFSFYHLYEENLGNVDSGVLLLKLCLSLVNKEIATRSNGKLFCEII